MARNFGNPNYDEVHDHAEPTSLQTTTVDDSASGKLRERAAVLFIFGVIGLIPPATPAGICLMVFGGALWALCPAAKANEDVMIAETQRTGNGCGAFLMALAVGVAIIMIALALAVGALDLMVAEGMVSG